HLFAAPAPPVPEHQGLRPAKLAFHLVQVGAADADRAHPHHDLVRARLGEVDLDDLERPADRVEDRGPRLQDSTSAVIHARAALTSAQLVTVETFWSAKLIDALCQSAFIVEQPSSGTTMKKPLSAPVRDVCSIDMFVHAPVTTIVSRTSPASRLSSFVPCHADIRIFSPTKPPSRASSPSAAACAQRS